MRRTRAHFYAGGPGLFSPATLFAGGGLGFALDPTNISNLSQDSAGTTPVTAATQPVGRELDISGNNNHPIQATAGARPTYQTTGGFGHRLLDGVDDKLIFPINMLLGWTSGTCVWAGQIAVDPPAPANGPALGFFANGGAQEFGPFTDGVMHSGFLTNARKNCGDPGNMAAWHTADFRSSAGNFTAGFNAIDYFTTAVNTVAVTAGVAGYPALGQDGVAGGQYAGRTGRMIAINRVLNAADLAAARRWVAAGYGGAL